MTLNEEFSAYARWREELANAVQQLRTWLINNDVSDAQADMRLQHVLERVRQDKLVVAFVAEFSRGKSELINAIFFSGYGGRILPSSTGRTTMCPTELQWEKGQQPGLRLLPIETRASADSLAQWRRRPDQWVFEPIDAGNPQSMQRAFARVSETLRVPAAEAERLGFGAGESGLGGQLPARDGLVEVARWRHAVIQFPHPLLEQGLVIIDTPGLNAVGSEPELTLSLLPSAHAVLFVLGADTGVTQSDLSVWQKHVSVGRGAEQGCMVVLNKIDGLWDGLRRDQEIEAEIGRQVATAASVLSISQDQVFPVSAQKALLAKLSADEVLLQRSRLADLESALSMRLVPARQRIIGAGALAEAGEIIQRASEILLTRQANLREQMKEMTDLRGKNQGVIDYMMRKVRAEKEEFEASLQKYHAVRGVFTNLSNRVFGHIGMDVVRTEACRVREAMADATFSRGLRQAMLDFLATLRAKLRGSAQDFDEIARMLQAMYTRFGVEHGFRLAPPTAFSTLRYEDQIGRLERAFNDQFNTLGAMVTLWKGTLTERFFETIAVEARKTFEGANRDVEQWLRATMGPLEAQVREYQLQLKRRLENVRRVHDATGTLEARIEELMQAELMLVRQQGDLGALRTLFESALGQPLTADAAHGNGALAA